jgi:hypothetical protein
MGEIIISNEHYHQDYFMAADAAGNANGKIDSDEEFLAAAERYCMDKLQYCESFFSEYEDSGFTKYQMKDIFVPSSKIFTSTDSKIDLHLKDLKRADSCEDAAYCLCDLVRYDISADLKERILEGALDVFDGKVKAARISASAVLATLADSDLPAESKERMIDPIVEAIGRDYYIYDYDNTQIPVALGHIANSDVRLERKLEMTEAVMKKMGSKNKNTKGEASTTLHFIASDVCASDAHSFANLFVQRLKEGDEGTKLAALKGIYGLASSEATIDIKAGTIEHVIAALEDKSREVRLAVVSALSSCVQAGLPPDMHSEAMGIMKGLMKSKDKKVRRLVVGMMSFIAEGMFSSKEVQAKMEGPLMEALLSGDKVMREQAIQGLYHLFDAKIIEGASEETVKIIIKLLRSDDDYARNAAINTLLVLEETASEPLLSKIKKVLEKGESYDAPEVLKVEGPGKDGKIKKSKKYIATFKFSEIPKGAVKMMPVLNGWDQKKGKINGKKATAAVWMDWRDEAVMTVIKFYDAKGKFIGETMEFELMNPGYKEGEFYTE